MAAKMFEMFGVWSRFSLRVVDGRLTVFDAYVADAQERALPVFSCLPGVSREQAKALAETRYSAQERRDMEARGDE